MRRIERRLATACMCAVATALFTGAALAGNGKDSAPGQTKNDQATAQVTVVATVQAQAPEAQSSQGQSAQAQVSAPGQMKKSESSASAQTQVSSKSQSSSGASSNGQLQQSGNASPAVAGMKPANNTGHWTTCGATGGTSSSATCPAQQNATTEASAHSDSSKRYGNMQTAAQIAVSRGGTGVTLTGPGNSQPHKVAVCPHKKNPSGGVDVHAIKSYNSAACAPTQSQQVITSSVCGSTSVTTITTSSQAALHGMGKHLGVGIAKQLVTSSSSSTVVTPTGEVCASVKTPPGQVMTPPAVITPATVVTPATAPSSTVAPTTNAGSVLGTQTALSTPKAKHANHGVLGTVARVSGSTLPFTGFPLWTALVAALGLIVTGSALRRRGSAVDVH